MTALAISESVRRQHVALAQRLDALVGIGNQDGIRILRTAQDPPPIGPAPALTLERAGQPQLRRLDGRGRFHLTYRDPSGETTLAAAYAALSTPGAPIAADPESLSVLALAARLAASEIPVLIAGPTGTGKEVLSRFIHDHSPRRNAPFIAVNCAAMPEAMLEALLFGHQKGAFKGLIKLALLGAIAWQWGQGWFDRLFALGRGAAIGSQLLLAWQAIIGLLFALSAGLVLIALIDWPVQWLRRNQRLKMSFEEMRDEHKEAEGSPENKQAIRNRQRQLAMGGVAKAMQEAQFVLTNPSHFSVAMAYDPAKAAAPIVLAKGRGDKALAIRALAAELQLPTLEYPALARSVYFTTRENQVIREELYAAVAGVLAFVFSLKRGEQPHRPAIEVPVMLRFDAEGRLDPAART